MSTKSTAVAFAERLAVMYGDRFEENYRAFTEAADALLPRGASGSHHDYVSHYVVLRKFQNAADPHARAHLDMPKDFVPLTQAERDALDSVYALLFL